MYMLKDEVAAKLGITVQELMRAVTSEVDSRLTILWLVTIILLVPVFVIIMINVDERWSEISKGSRIYIGYAGIIGIVMFLYSLHEQISRSSLVTGKLFEFAKSLGVM